MIRRERTRTEKTSSFILLMLLLLVAGCSGLDATPSPTVSPQPTVTLIPSATFTYTPPPTATSIQPATPTPLANAIYYMIVLDASGAMNEPFDSRTKWDAARASAEAILKALEPGANFGLVLIGASSPTEEVDLCNEPSVPQMPFTSQHNVLRQVGQLQPAGGGSIFTAFNLAKDQFTGLPPHSIRVIIHISGSRDDCERNEWREFERRFQARGAVEAGLHSEIIILDDGSEISAQALAVRIGNLSRNVNVQTVQSFGEIRQTTEVVLGNVRNHIASIPTVTPPPTSTAFSTLTPVPILSATPTLSPVPPSNTPTSTLTPSPAPPTVTLTSTLTSTPSATPSPTPVLPPSVTLLSVRYLTDGIGCQIDVRARVNGSDAVGRFHVWYAGLDPQGQIYPQTTLQVGTNWASVFSLRNLLTLGGDRQGSRHEVWFEYNGIQSNRLKDLLCPLPPP
jgi:hypothetical protein